MVTTWLWIGTIGMAADAREPACGNQNQKLSRSRPHTPQPRMWQIALRAP